MSIDIPNYRILEKLGNGANSTLFKVRCTRTGQLYTVKNVKVQSPEDNKFIDQLKAEYATGKDMDHPVIRKVFELRYVRRRLRIKAALLFMEYVEGKPMNAPDYKLPSLNELLRLFQLTADGLDAMHQAGFVHADLKPGNILVTPPETVGGQAGIKLIDFGQSCDMLTSKSRVQGTVDYMAPEQARKLVLDRRTDVFGLAATLHRVVTGKPIETIMNKKMAIHTTGMVGLRGVDNTEETGIEVPLPLTKFIETCCNKDASKRLPDMRAFVDRLEMIRTIIAKREVAQEDDGAQQPTSADQA